MDILPVRFLGGQEVPQIGAEQGRSKVTGLLQDLTWTKVLGSIVGLVSLYFPRKAEPLL